MNGKPDNWVEFWNRERVFGDVLWKKNMEVFIRSTEPLLKYCREDIVADIGCGAGYLAEFLKERVKEIHCLDTSQRYVEACRERFKNAANVFVHKLDETGYTSLSPLETGRFSVIICLSVIQYYRNAGEVEKLVEEVRRIARRGARFLIADIPSARGKLADSAALLRTGIKEKCLFEIVKFMVRAGFSEYSRLRSSPGLLMLPDDELHELTARLKLDAEVLTTRMTLQRNRKHLLIRF